MWLKLYFIWLSQLDVIAPLFCYPGQTCNAYKFYFETIKLFEFPNYCDLVWGKWRFTFWKTGRTIRLDSNLKWPLIRSEKFDRKNVGFEWTKNLRKLMKNLTFQYLGRKIGCHVSMKSWRKVISCISKWQLPFNLFLLVLIVGHIFGLLPVSGILSRKVHSLAFKPVSFTVIYSGLLQLIFITDFFLTMKFVLSANFKFNFAGKWADFQLS